MDKEGPSQVKKSSGLRSRFRNVFPRSASTASSPPQDPTESTTLVYSDVASTSAPESISTGNVPSQNSNAYTAIGGVPTTPVEPLTRAFRGLITTVQALSDCSDIFLPLKTACNVILTIHKMFDRVSTNRDQLQELEVKLAAILEIVKKYQQHGGIDALQHRIKSFCRAVELQVDAIKHLQDRPVSSRIAEGTEDADKIVKAFRTMGILCDVFQMDTQLSVESTVNVILQRLRSGVIERLRHETTSYKTRVSSYGDAHGCLVGTRVKILADLEAWAMGVDGCKVYWLVGMAGTGKSTISHTLCEILDRGSLLGASFFCSRASTKTNDARLIIPTIAHALACASPPIKARVVEAIEEDDTLPEPTYGKLEDRFHRLVRDPLQASIGADVKRYKVVVIDAVDECTNLNVVSSLIKLILRSASRTPLKIFIASRDEPPIRAAFDSASSLRQRFILHEVEKDVVESDIRRYIETSLAEINDPNGDQSLDGWPSSSELSKLIKQCGKLFIYAATAIRYITESPGFCEDRLSSLTTGSEGKSFQNSLDDLYGQILKQACMFMEQQEIRFMRDLMSLIVFLQNPLPIESILALSGTAKPARRLLHCISLLKSVIHVPDEENTPVTLFHASFFDFVTDPARCTPERSQSFHALSASEGHDQLALKCLVHMNDLLRYNICDAPDSTIVSRREADNSPHDVNKIPEALRYSCLHWATHLAGVQPEQPSIKIFAALRQLLNTHLLHWMECLSVLGQLRTGITSLQHASTALSRFKTIDYRYHDLQLLVDDARRCLQMNIEAVRKHCMEIYQSSLVWIPKKSLIRQVYATYVSRVPVVTQGLLSTWGPAELIIYNGSKVKAIAISHDSKRIVAGSQDAMVRIWNAATGEMEAELRGHTAMVHSVAFSPDSSRVISGSGDKTIRIWNITTSEMEAELKGHTGSVTSVVLSHDGSRVISGSIDRTARIWNVTTGEMEFKLEGHTHWVISVAFSQDRSQVASGSLDGTVQIWKAMTGEMETKLEGQTGLIWSVAFSQDGSRVVFGSHDMVTIWNMVTGELELELNGHKNSVLAVAFSPNSRRVVSGSDDKTIRIWNAITGEMEANMKGHTDAVRSVAFSQDGSRVVSGSDDTTVQIWNVTMDIMEAQLKNSHTDQVWSVAFSQDGSRIVSASQDETIRIWNATTGEMEAELKGQRGGVWLAVFSQDGNRVVSLPNHRDLTGCIWNLALGKIEAEIKGHLGSSVAFSPDDNRVASGSSDGTVRICNAMTGDVELELEGDTGDVWSVAFSQDGSRVVSGSQDGTVCIWSAKTGEMQAQLKGHMYMVLSVAFSQNDSRVLSGSQDNKLRIWDVTTGKMDVELHGAPHSLSSVALALDTSGVIPQSFEDVIISIRNVVSGTPQPRNFLISLSCDGDWILGTHSDCWIPGDYRSFNSVSFSGSRACFGCVDGRVIILDMTLA